MARMGRTSLWCLHFSKSRIIKLSILIKGGFGSLFCYVLLRINLKKVEKRVYKPPKMWYNGTINNKNDKESYERRTKRPN